ncbi:RuBisCO accumulation factor 1 [Lyngbya confervoides]|uniref:RuBisCO accumulation factor 1 n=1 Tax=Lyngbya confervoides BDU141951 TaxID=1574623 RepID=A0ABD4T707_9CYAN|nr:RuBisCO accumulation factor 1 [Lyngbya confervoides]MCM1984421.1 hypothetical protein [Lyngbya confervoides BDU141951]
MSQFNPSQSFASGTSETLAEAERDRLLQMLRRKEETWPEWGRACQILQKAGYSPQSIFEATGFEPIQQNQIIVSFQIYTNLYDLKAPNVVLDYFAERRSDVLYEFRILGQRDRVKAATLAVEHQLDADEAHLIAKDLRDVARVQELPQGFTEAPGDMVAYECWRLARQQSDLQERSRLIGRGLRFVSSQEARQHLEKLLTDFSVVKPLMAPTLPLYRLDQSDDMPRIVPVIGRWPLVTHDLVSVPVIASESSFQVVQHHSAAAWVAIPGWQVLLQAEDPMAFLASSDELSLPIPDPVEEVLVILDRSQRQWSGDSYFLYEEQGVLRANWFSSNPEMKLLGRIILIIRPHRISKDLSSLESDLWQVDE